MKNKVVLFHPPYDGPPLGPPLSLLSLASPLLAAGFQVSIVDGSIEPEYKSRLARELPGALCLGISLLTGRMIRSAVDVSRFVRGIHPELPIIFGGWHPSLLPAQTLREDFVDAVVRGQGEVTLREAAERLATGSSFESVRGISFKHGGEAVQNVERPVESVERLPTPAFAMANLDAYEKVTGVRKLPYASSVGCPYACHYCTDQVFYNRRFNAYSAGRVVSEVTELVARYRLSEVPFLDSNFPVNVKRAVEIAKGFVDSKLRFGWTFQASTDLLCRMTDAEVCMLGEAGVSHMGFGTESASQEVLALMNKKHQRVDEMYETARKSEQAGIRVTFNLILGYPGETEADRLETFRIMSDIAYKHSNVSFSPNIFTPYPGIPIWPELRKMGVREPQSLEEWANVDLGSNHLPWLQGRELDRLKRMLEFFLLHNQIRKVAVGAPWIRRGLRRALGVPLRWRLRRNEFSMPWELWLARATERLVTRRSLLTGQTLRHGMQEVC
ncbi:MAG: B12-binding domain-containing radical SAM protein [Terriglobia bacterium]